MAHRLIIKTLKNLLKTQKVNYELLGSEIGMSVSGLKKLLNGSDISLNRLSQIGRVLGISVSDIVRMAEEEEIKTVQLSNKQEIALCSDWKLFEIFWLLTVAQRPLAEIQRSQKLNSQDFKKSIDRLTHLELFKVSKSGKVIATQSGPYRWANSSRLAKKLNNEWSKSILDHVLKHSEGKNSLHRLSYLKLTPESRAQWYIQLNEIFDNYARRSNREKLERHHSELESVSTLIASAPYEFVRIN